MFLLFLLFTSLFISGVLLFLLFTSLFISGVLLFLLFTSLFISPAFLFFLLFTSLFISPAFCSSCCLRACSSARRFVPLVVYEFVHQQDVLFFLLFTSLFISRRFHPLAYELVPRLDASHLLAFELLRLLPFF